MAQISLMGFVSAAPRLCLLALSHDAERNRPDLQKLGQITKEEHKSLVCELGRAEQTGQGTKW